MLRFIWLCAFVFVPRALWGQANTDAAVIGSLLDSGGTPIKGNVTAYLMEISSGRITPHLECSIPTGNEGAFRCDRMRSGSYLFVFALESPRDNGTRPTTGAVGSDASGSALPNIVFYPHTGPDEALRLLPLAPGETQVVDTTVNRSRLSTLIARPRNGSATGQVQLFSEAEGLSIPLNIQPKVNRDGNYEWTGLPSGSYSIIETWYSDNQEHHVARSAELVTDQAQFFSRSEPTLYKLSGLVKATGDKLLEGAHAILVTKINGRVDQYVAPVQPGGRVLFAEIPEGTYRFSFDVGDHLAVGSILLDQHDATDALVTLAGDSTTHVFTVDAQQKTASLSGAASLNGSEPHPGVVIESLDSLTSFVIPLRNDGTFFVKQLALAHYRVFAFDDVQKTPYATPEYLLQHSRDSIEIDLDSSGVSGLMLTCQHDAL